MVVIHMLNWLVVSTNLKNISQNGNLPQMGMKIKNVCCQADCIPAESDRNEHLSPILTKQLGSYPDLYPALQWFRQCFFGTMFQVVKLCLNKLALLRNLCGNRALRRKASL